MDSPVSNNGRGLKRLSGPVPTPTLQDSPVSNNGRGLKQCGTGASHWLQHDSPVSNNGRGLKLEDLRRTYFEQMIRPLAITGVD